MPAAIGVLVLKTNMHFFLFISTVLVSFCVVELGLINRFQFYYIHALDKWLIGLKKNKDHFH